jgi:chemotaxis protein MotA
MMDQGHVDQNAMDVILRSRINAILASKQRAGRVLKTLTWSLFSFGLIAFLLGAQNTFFELHTMPAALGGMLAHTLVGPLVGVFLAGCIVQPLANRLEAAVAEDANFYEFVRTAFFCRLASGDGALAVRTACGALPTNLSLSDEELDFLPRFLEARPA